MFCVNCGKEAPEGTLYCTKCGTKLVTVEEVKASSEKRNSERDTKSKNGLKIFIIALVTFVLLSGLTVAGISIFYKSNTEMDYEEYDDDDIDDKHSSKGDDKDQGDCDDDSKDNDSSDKADGENAEEAVLEQMSMINLISGTVLQKYMEVKNYQQNYSFDKVVEGTLGFRVDDFDNDGDNELLQVDVIDDGRIVINMYDYSRERGNLGVSTYQAGNCNICDMGQLDIFTFDYEDRSIIGVYQYQSVFLYADGVGLDARFLEYDGTGFIESGKAGYAGSDGEPDDEFEQVFWSYGIEIDWGELFSGDNTVTKYLSKDCRIATVYQPCTNPIHGEENLKKTEFDKTYLGGYNNVEAEEFSERYSLEGQRAVDFMIPDSRTRKLTNEDLMGFTKEELRIARNEILARYGRKFKDKELQAYFDSKSWYTGYIEADDFNENILSDIESANMYFIKAFENDYDKYH